MRLSRQLPGFWFFFRTGYDNDEERSKWQCISAAFSSSASISSTTTAKPSSSTATPSKVLPQDIVDVMKLTWDGYCAANRACDGHAMAKVFHPTCRLTYAVAAAVAQHNNKNDSSVHVKDQNEFCRMVTHRYDAPSSSSSPKNSSISNPHYAYRHLLQTDKNDQGLVVSQGDSILSVEFASPVIALVTLRVGHPPFLWTDLLTVAKLSSSWKGDDDKSNSDTAAQQQQQQQQQPQWWIVHKSSCSETISCRVGTR